MVTPLLPKLTLDFTTAALDGRITFARTTGASSPATYVNSGGYITAATNDQPRFDYDPISNACKGLLIEESITNVILESQSMDGANWLRINLNTTGTPPYVDVAISPDGTQNADKLIESTANGSHDIRQAYTGSVSTAYTYSFFAKAAERTKVNVFIGGPGASAEYDLIAGTSLGAGSSIQSYGNGWYRCIITAATTAGSGAFNAIVILNNGTTTSYTGDGTSGLYAWGFQLEAGGVATSYIPTTAAALTRNADVATITGSNFSDFWQATKGGTSALYIPSTTSGTRPVVQFDDGTANEIIALQGNAADPELYIVDGGTPQAQIDAGTLVAGTTHTLTGWWEPNFCAARLDNGARFVDNSATIPTVTQMRLGSDGTNYLNGHLAVVSYYDKFSGQIYTRRKNKAVFSVL